MARKGNRPGPPDSGHARPMVLGAALVLLLACLLRLPALGERFQDPGRYFHGPGLPLLTNLDGYHYLTRARDLAREWAGLEALPTADPARPTSMLDALAAGLHLATGASLESIALYLPPLAALLMIGFYFLWGRASGDFSLGLFAALAGICAPIFFRRTAPGFFDTDCLNPFFICLAGLFAYLFVRGRTPVRFAHLGGCLASLAALAWWWRPGIAGAVLGLLAAAYALSVFTPELKRERKLKYALLAAMVLGGGGVLLFMNHLPVPVREFFQSVAAHLHLVAKQTSGAMPEIGASITELSRPGAADVAAALGGWPMLAAGTAGLGLLAWRRPGQALFLLPLLFLGGLGLAAKRLLIFAAPLIAVGFGFLASEFWRAWSARPARRALVTALAAAVLCWSGYVCLRDPALPFLSPGEVELAAEIKDASPPEAVVWTWWDYGYMVEYEAQRRAFITGGSQSPLRTYLAARGLAAEDPGFAARWMRFFAARGPAGFTALEKQEGGPGQAVALIQNKLAEPDGDPAFSPSFPPVVLYLPAKTMNMAAWIFQYATWDFDARASAEPAIARLDNHAWRVDQNTGLLACDLGTLPLARLAILGKDGRSTTAVFDDTRETSLATVQGWEYAYVLGEEMFRMLMVRLLALEPSATPDFTLLDYRPDAGGVWMVE